MRASRTGPEKQVIPQASRRTSCVSPSPSITVTIHGRRSDRLSESGRRRPDKIVIYWEREYSTAFPPERLKLDFHPHRPMVSNMTLDEQRALAAGGYKVLPDDCGPVRTVGSYGWLIRSPADVKLRRTASGVQWQSPPIAPEERLLGYKTYLRHVRRFDSEQRLSRSSAAESACTIPNMSA